MRLSSPSEHPYPLVIAGSSVGNKSYQADGFGPARPGQINDAFGSYDLYTAFYVNSAGVFVTEPTTEPMQGVSSNTSIMNTRGGSTFMCPVFWRDEQNTYMQLQNLFVIRTINMLSESSYTDSDNRKYRIFAQGVTDYDYEFLALLEDIGTTTTTIAPTTTTTIAPTTTTT